MQLRGIDLQLSAVSTGVATRWLGAAQHSIFDKQLQDEQVRSATFVHAQDSATQLYAYCTAAVCMQRCFCLGLLHVWTQQLSLDVHLNL